MSEEKRARFWLKDVKTTADHHESVVGNHECTWSQLTNCRFPRNKTPRSFPEETLQKGKYTLQMSRNFCVTLQTFNKIK
jgi:hypothetical protein